MSGYQFVATDGATEIVVPTAGVTVTILFPADTTLTNFVALGGTSQPLSSNNRTGIITLDGTDGGMTVSWQETPFHDPSKPPPPPSPWRSMQIVASSAARGTVKQGSIPGQKTLILAPRGATVGLSTVAKLAIGASVVAVGAVGVVAANRTATGSAIAAEAMENIRRSRV